tara:strand:+ start:1546 stop:2793 length:1248 start_codon:yes stop_codon:yes gene_type:complete
MKNKPIRVGVVGVNRGRGFANGAGPQLGMELVAICDTWEQRLYTTAKKLKVSAYTDFDEFLGHDMDAVILANYFHQHAPFAIKALHAGYHVMSETAACHTLAEGVELIRTVEQTGKMYMFAENYPYMRFNQEMKRVYKAGTIGTFMYGEGEYVHPMSADTINKLAPGVNHWRNWIPATYYSTHSLAPLMYITDTWPVQVSAHIIKHREDDPVPMRVARLNDAASMIVLKMDNGALVKLLQVYLRGEGVWVRIHGSRGQIENMRHGDRDIVRLTREQYHEELTKPEEQIYKSEFPHHAEAAGKAGHGGGDFFMNYHFAESIRKNEPPYLDVYRGVVMSIVGPIAYRSALDNSSTLNIPDFRIESTRHAYEIDDWSPDPDRSGKGQPWPSIEGKKDINPNALKYAKGNWKEIGYTKD